ncbi:MAG: hypothetical protein ABI380_10670 [Edaphobacter sp.]
MRLLQYSLCVSALIIAISSTSGAQQKVFTITISTPHPAFKAGDSIPLNIKLKNISDHTAMVALNSQDVGAGSTFEITVIDSSGTEVPLRASTCGEHPCTFSGGTLPVPSGTEIHRTENLDRLFDLKPDKYTVHVKKIERDTKVVQESNTIRLTVALQ